MYREYFGKQWKNYVTDSDVSTDEDCPDSTITNNQTTQAKNGEGSSSKIANITATSSTTTVVNSSTSTSSPHHADWPRRSERVPSLPRPPRPSVDKSSFRTVNSTMILHNYTDEINVGTSTMNRDFEIGNLSIIEGSRHSRSMYAEPGPSNAYQIEDLTTRNTPPPKLVIKRKNPKYLHEKRSRPKWKEVEKMSLQLECPEVIVVDEFDMNSSQENDVPKTAENPPAQPEKVETPVDKHQELNRTLLKLLECPVCFEFMSPPIQNCKRGHLVCKACRLRLESCPYCRSRLCETRNLAMEQVAESLLYPCEFHAVGCPTQVLLRSKIIHEHNCEYKIYSCFFDVCIWKGQYNEVMAHMEESHSNRLLFGSEHDLVVGFIDVLSMNWLVSVFGELFHLNMAFKHTDFNMCVRYVGPVDKASNYTYSIDISVDTPIKRRISFTRMVHKFNEKLSSIQTHGENFYLKSNVAKLFMNEGFLKCSIDIKQM